ncbi:MAG TPA: hypothetical protein VF828_01905 [Patescibacteria group bacterium]
MKRIKNISFLAFVGIITISSILNISRQWSILQNAKAENRQWEIKNAELKGELSDIQERLKYATSSGNMEAQAREELGIGTSNDYWIIAGKESEAKDLFPDMKESSKVPPILQWIEMFTKQSP